VRNALRRPIWLLVWLAAVFSAPHTFAAAPPVMGSNQPVLVICVRWSDAATTRMANCSDWVTLLNNETNTFYNRATFNQTSFLFQTVSGAGAPPDGWYNLGYASTGYDFFKTSQDAVNLADPNANLSQFNRVLVITNWPDFGGQGGGPWWWKVNEGVEATFIEGGVSVGKRLMTMSVVNEWLAHSYGNTFDEAASVAAHELGHQLGAPTHYGTVEAGGFTRDRITPWDIMGLSPTLNHFLGWAKTNRGWVPAGPQIQTVGPPVGSDIDTTITLRPLEQSSTGVQVIRIPKTTSASLVGYVVENRRQINGDENLPAQGVLFTMVNEDAGTALNSIVLDDPASPGNLNDAPLDVGGVYSDPTLNLTLTVLSQSGNDYNVRVQYRLPPASKPDPAITPWGAPPWESPDIWIDSQKNGWGTYRYKDTSGNPVGNGDDAWVNHANRIYVRVRNLGPGVATNVRVQVYQNDPPGMGDAGPNWNYLGTIIFPTIGATPVQDFVSWTASVAAHTCIKAVIEDTPGELTTANNIAQENVTAFDTSSGSPYHPTVLQTMVNNPFRDRELDVHLVPRNVPKDWGVLLEPPRALVPPGGRTKVLFMVFPSGAPCAPPKEQNETYRPGFIGKPQLEALMPYEDTFIPIGGIDVWTHLVKATRLTCQLEGEKTPTAPPKTEASRGPAAARQMRDLESMTAARAKRGLTPAEAESILKEGSMVKPPVKLPTVPPGTVVVVTGLLEPAVDGAPIAVELTGPKSREGQVQLVKTGPKGEYRARLKPPAAGRWSVQSYFAGDATLGQSDSGQCPFVVR
jgi:M6 family metalloprotease-like protein